MALVAQQLAVQHEQKQLPTENTGKENIVTQETLHLGDLQPSFETMDRNSQRLPTGWSADWEQCVICGRWLNPESVTVRVLVNPELNLLPTDAAVIPPEFESQPLGESCLRKIPRNYRWSQSAPR